jgi:glutaredoxin
MKKEENDSQITMYGRDTCGFTVKMKNELKKTGLIKIIRYVDVTTPEGESEFKSKGFDGVPAFEGNGRVAMGYMKSTDLLKKLNL